MMKSEGRREEREKRGEESEERGVRDQSMTLVQTEDQ